MQKVLVTGATGFIGNHVIEELLRRNCQVIASSANESKVRQRSWFNKVTYKPLDFDALKPDANYYTYFERPQYLIHLAWQGLPNYRDNFHVEKNLPLHCTFIQNLITNGLKNLSVTGTCFEYGMQEGALKEDMPALPDNPYGIAKNELRKFIETLQARYHFLLKWIRLFYMYGKGQTPNALISQLDKALENNQEFFNMSGGQQVRDFLPVEKVAAYIVEITLQNHTAGIINCCSGQPVTVETFIKGYLKQKNKSIKLNLGYYPYPDYEPMNFWGDKDKLNKILNKRK